MSLRRLPLLLRARRDTGVRSRAQAAVALGVVTVLALGACGGDEDTPAEVGKDVAGPTNTGWYQLTVAT